MLSVFCKVPGFGSLCQMPSVSLGDRRSQSHCRRLREIGSRTPSLGLFSACIPELFVNWTTFRSWQGSWSCPYLVYLAWFRFVEVRGGHAHPPISGVDSLREIE